MRSTPRHQRLKIGGKIYLTTHTPGCIVALISHHRSSTLTGEGSCPCLGAPNNFSVPASSTATGCVTLARLVLAARAVGPPPL